jgi:predicted  nucleic acid-binding Zn-ribbon protein
MRTVDALRQLQDIDSRLDSTRAAVRQLGAQLEEAGPVPALVGETDAARGELRQLEPQQRDLELQAEERRSKIAADEGKLYGGRVTNPKELSSLADEVAQDRRQLSTIEDKLLELFDQVDSATTRLKELEATLAEETRTWNARQEQVRAKLHEAELAAAGLEERRSSAAGAVDGAARSTYELLRRQKGGVAVAQVQQRTCQACRVSLTPAQEQRARIGNDLVTCTSCGRILFVPIG